MFDPSFRHGNWYYVRSCGVVTLDDGVIDVMVEFGQQITSPITSMRCGRCAAQWRESTGNATAFHGRHTGFTFINGNS